MDKSGKFLLPSPKFQQQDKPFASTPHFLTPQGMLLPKHKQPPPMYGPRGSTVPPQFLGRQQTKSNQPEKTQKHYCKSCEAEFHTPGDLKIHCSEHVPCEIKDCTFMCHPSFMDMHIGLQHAKGLYNQVKKLSTPEEIAQWRAERSKNYPTVGRVMQKEKAREQRMLRGERLEKNKNRFGKREDRRQMRGDQQEQQKKREERGPKPESAKRARKRNRIPKETPAEVKEDEEPTCHGVKMFKGTSGMPDYRTVKKTESYTLSSLLGMYGSASDSEEKTDSDVETNLGEKAVHEATRNEEARDTDLCSTDGAKESSVCAEKETTASQEVVTEEPTEPVEGCETLEVHPSTVLDDETCTSAGVEAKTQASTALDDETCTSTVLEAKTQASSAHTSTVLDEKTPSSTVPAEQTNIPTVPEIPASDDEAPEEEPIAKHSNVPDRPQAEVPRKKAKFDHPKRRAIKSGLDYRKLRTPCQNTMLEKLLEPDIRHERNVLLQCVRFVVENNFFGIGSSSQS